MNCLLKVGLGHAEASCCLKDAVTQLWLGMWPKNNRSKSTLAEGNGTILEHFLQTKERGKEREGKAFQS